MDKSLEAHRHCIGHGADFVKRHLARKDYAVHAELLEETGTPGGSGVALCGSVQRNWRQIHAQETQILNDKSVDTGGMKVGDGAAHVVDRVIVDERVERHIHLGAETVSVLTNKADILDGIGRGGAGAMVRTAYVDSVGATVDGGDGCFAVTCRREELEGTRTGGSHF